MMESSEEKKNSYVRFKTVFLLNNLLPALTVFQVTAIKALLKLFLISTMIAYKLSMGIRIRQFLKNFN